MVSGIRPRHSKSNRPEKPMEAEAAPKRWLAEGDDPQRALSQLYAWALFKAIEAMEKSQQTPYQGNEILSSQQKRCYETAQKLCELAFLAAPRSREEVPFNSKTYRSEIQAHLENPPSNVSAEQKCLSALIKRLSATMDAG